MQFINTRELEETLRRNGFKDAARAVKRFSSRSKPQHIKAKLEQWKQWEASDGWPWAPKWERKSDKDWYAIRESCPY